MPSHPATPDPDPLGDRYRAYRPAPLALAGGFLLGLGSFAMGASLLGISWYGAAADRFDLPVYTDHGWSWFAVGFSSLLGGAAIFVGWTLAKSAHELLGYSVELRRLGFRVRSAGHADEVLWANVLAIRQLTLKRGRLLLFAPLLPYYQLTVNHYYQVALKNGKEYEFGRQAISGKTEFVKILREVALQNSIPWLKADEQP